MKKPYRILFALVFIPLIILLVSMATSGLRKKMEVVSADFSPPQWLYGSWSSELETEPSLNFTFDSEAVSAILYGTPCDFSKNCTESMVTILESNHYMYSFLVETCSSSFFYRFERGDVSYITVTIKNEEITDSATLYMSS
jgi:hypothetical protein